MSGYQRILESQSLALRRVSCSGLTVSEAASENARKCKHFGKESGVTSSGTERDVLGCWPPAVNTQPQFFNSIRFYCVVDDVRVTTERRSNYIKTREPITVIAVLRKEHILPLVQEIWLMQFNWLHCYILKYWSYSFTYNVTFFNTTQESEMSVRVFFFFFFFVRQRLISLSCM